MEADMPRTSGFEMFWIKSGETSDEVKEKYFQEHPGCHDGNCLFIFMYNWNHVPPGDRVDSLLAEKARIRAAYNRPATNAGLLPENHP